MTAAHDLPPAIQWHEGMLLAPQHFQQAARRQDGLLHYHVSLVSPFHWGVRHLKVDPIQLVDGSFRVLELEAVLPDGLVVSHLSDDGELALDLKEHAAEMRRQALTVFLAVTAASSGLPAFTGDLARYDSLPGAPVTDANTGEGELRIPRLRPRLRLLAGDELPKKFVGFPLARLRHANETFTQTDYVPPTLRVALSSPLGELCQQLAQRLREKAAFLADQVRSPILASRVPQLLETRQKIHALVAALPQLEAVLYTGSAHPYTLYLALSHLVGHVAAVGHGLIPPLLEAYDHDDPRAAFAAAADFLFQAVEEGVDERYTAFALYEDDGSFYIDFDESWMARRLLLGARTRDDVSADATVEWMERSLVGSDSKMPSMRVKRIRGAEHRRLDREADLVPSSGVTLFSLAADPRFIVGGETLRVLNLDDPQRRHRPAEIVLYVENAPREDEP